MKCKKILLISIMTLCLYGCKNISTKTTTTEFTTETTTVSETIGLNSSELIDKDIKLDDFVNNFNEKLSHTKLYEDTEFTPFKAVYTEDSDTGKVYSISINSNVAVFCTIADNSNIKSIIIMGAGSDSTDSVLCNLVMNIAAESFDTTNQDIFSLITDFNFDTATGGTSEKTVGNYKYNYQNAQNQGKLLRIEKLQ